MNASIFFKSRRHPIHLDLLRWKLPPKKRCTRFATEWITRTDKQVERVVVNALETAAPPPRIFWIQHCCEKLAFGDSIVLRIRRSTLAPVYV